MYISIVIFTFRFCPPVSFLCVSCCARFAELFVAAAAGEAVAVLLSSSLMLPSVAGAGRCNVVAVFPLFFLHVIRLARCRHRVLGGARMVDVSATRSESELPNSGKFVLLSPRD